MNENDHSFQSILNMLLVVAVIISAFAFIHTFKDTRRYGGIDLRGRVTGGRLLIEGLDPYYFRWGPAYSDRLLDPLDAPNRKVSRAGIISSITLSGVSVWQSYFSAMPMLGKTNLNLLHFVRSRYANRYKIIEGMNNLHKHLKFPADSSSLQTLFAKYLGLSLSSSIFLFSLMILLFMISLFLFRYRLKHVSSHLLFLIGAELVVMSEYFMPPNRFDR